MWAPRTQRYEYILHDLTVALQREGLFSNPVEEDQEFIEEREVRENIHEDNTSIFVQPIEENEEICEGQEQYEESSQWLKESLR